ncbi:TPA: hypothetical protein ACGF6V_002736 [Vibrio cholerae]
MLCKHPAGVACRCNLKGDCLVRYQITSDAGLFEFKNGDNKFSTIKLVDKGQGTKVNIAIEGKCTNNLTTCPTGYLSDERSFSEALSTSQCKDHTLFYRPKRGENMGLLEAIQNLFTKDKSKGVPYTSYKVCITQCAGKPQTMQTQWLTPPIQYLLGDLLNDTFIDVYPQIKIQPKLTLSGKYIKKEINDEERYKAYKYKEKANQLDGLSIPTDEIRKGFSISGELSITTGSHVTQYGLGYERVNSNIPGQPSTRNLSAEFEGIKKQVQLVNAICTVVEQVQSGIYSDKPGKEDIKLYKFEYQPPSISIEGEQILQMTNGIFDTTGKVILKLNPIVGFEIKLDMLMAAAKWFKIDSAIGLMREKAAQLEEKVKNGQKGAYAGAEFDITLKTTLNATATIHHKSLQEPTYYLETEVEVPIIGDLNARSGARVWVMEGAFKLESRIQAQGMLALTSKTKNRNAKAELVFYHGGIWAEVSIENSFNFDSNQDDKNQSEDSGLGGLQNKNKTNPPSDSKKHRWDWVGAMDKQTSPYRVTVLD